MNTFADAVSNFDYNTVARTANAMKTPKNTSDKVLDLFGKIGSSRGRDITPDFVAAFAESPELALRVLMWSRDIRGGAGERQTFRTLLNGLEKSNPRAAASIMHKIPLIGRWDDLFVYEDPTNRSAAIAMIAEALDDGNALCAKWMPRKGKVAVELTKAFDLTPRQYRKTIVNLTNVVETEMCAKNWDKINFSHIPSVASARYQKAFGRNASEAYSAYIHELQKPVAERSNPKVKINASAVYPYDVIKSVGKGNAAVADEQWKAMPDYIGSAKIFPMVDVSGSMGSLGYDYGTGPSPILAAVSLGLYCADKNQGAFKDLFLTFSGKPNIVKVKGTLSEKMRQMSTADWGMNTNLNAAMDHILSVAIKGRVHDSDMPEVLLILSDMQFDRCVRFDDSALQMTARKFTNAGFTMPRVVFWNLTTGYENTPVKFDQRGTALISGFSPAIMKSVLASDLENFTPYNVMLKTIMNERYDLSQVVTNQFGLLQQQIYACQAVGRRFESCIPHHRYTPLS